MFIYTENPPTSNTTDMMISATSISATEYENIQQESAELPPSQAFVQSEYSSTQQGASQSSPMIIHYAQPVHAVQSLSAGTSSQQTIFQTGQYASIQKDAAHIIMPLGVLPATEQHGDDQQEGYPLAGLNSQGSSVEQEHSSIHKSNSSQSSWSISHGQVTRIQQSGNDLADQRSVPQGQKDMALQTIVKNTWKVQPVTSQQSVQPVMAPQSLQHEKIQPLQPVMAPHSMQHGKTHQVQPVMAPQSVQPVMTPQSVQLVTSPQCLQPVMAPQNVQPVMTPQSVQPVTSPQIVQPVMTPHSMQHGKFHKVQPVMAPQSVQSTPYVPCPIHLQPPFNPTQAVPSKPASSQPSTSHTQQQPSALEMEYTLQNIKKEKIEACGDSAQGSEVGEGLGQSGHGGVTSVSANQHIVIKKECGDEGSSGQSSPKDMCKPHVLDTCDNKLNVQQDVQVQKNDPSLCNDDVDQSDSSGGHSQKWAAIPDESVENVGSSSGQHDRRKATQTVSKTNRSFRTTSIVQKLVERLKGTAHSIANKASQQKATPPPIPVKNTRLPDHHKTLSTSAAVIKPGHSSSLDNTDCPPQPQAKRTDSQTKTNKTVSKKNAGAAANKKKKSSSTSPSSANKGKNKSKYIISFIQYTYSKSNILILHPIYLFFVQYASGI